MTTKTTTTTKIEVGSVYKDKDSRRSPPRYLRVTELDDVVDRSGRSVKLVNCDERGNKIAGLRNKTRMTVKNLLHRYEKVTVSPAPAHDSVAEAEAQAAAAEHGVLGEVSALQDR